jgi:hypothetical protein
MPELVNQERCEAFESNPVSKLRQFARLGSVSNKEPSLGFFGLSLLLTYQFIVFFNTKKKAFQKFLLC